MARTDERFKSTFNKLLDQCAYLGKGAQLPSEFALATDLNVSRTVIRSALTKLNEDRIISWAGRTKTVLRRPRASDRLEVVSEPPTPEELESRFFDWVLRFDVPAGTPLNVKQMSRDFEVPAHSLQEFLASLSRFGLVQRRQKGGWELVGFTEDFAIELSDFRSVLELNAVSQVVARPEGDAIWAKLAELKQKHLELADNIDTRFHDFSRLDESFHEALYSVVKNRFVKEFQRVISMIFHYHYQWEKDTEKTRNEQAINEHLRLIEALLSRDEEAASRAAKEHLATAKRTLLASMRSHKFT